MMVKASNTAITNAAVLGPGRSESKEETIIIKRIKRNFPKKSHQVKTHFGILQVEHSFSEYITLS